MDTVANGCSYCCIQNRNTSKVLTFEEIDAFMQEHVLDKDVKFFEFFGGEPTIHYEIIKQVVDKYPQFNYRMYTNGLFDFDQWYDVLCRFGEVLFSHDGYGKFNSKRGIGNTKFVTELCESNIRKSINNGIPTSIAIVPSTEEHYDQLREIVGYFYKNYKARSFSLEIPSVIQDKHVNNRFSKRHFNKIVDFFFDEVVPDFLEKGVDDKYLFNIPKEHYPGQLNTVPCSESVLALSPSGKIYHCRDTAANESNLVKENVLHFYSSIDEIKKIEVSNTCHVKVMQGYDNSKTVDESNVLEVKAMYQILGLMNYFYEMYVDEDFSGCIAVLDIIENIYTLYSAIKEKQNNAANDSFVPLSK